MSARLTDAELQAAYERRDWPALWQQGLLYVRPTLSLMVTRGQLRAELVDEDARQQAALYVGEVIRLWRPLESGLGTWITNKIIWRMLLWQRALQSAPETVSEGEDETQPDLGNLDLAVYEDAPEGYGDPLHEASVTEQRISVRVAVALLRDPAERAALAAVYGLDGLGGMSVADYAAASGMALRTVDRVLARAREGLALKLRAA